MDLPCFSRGGSFTSWYPFLLLFFVQARVKLLALNIVLLQNLLSTLFVFFFSVFLPPLVHTTSSSNPSSNLRRRTSLATKGFFLRRSFPSISPAVSVTAVCGNISIFHVCMVWIEKSVMRVTDRHHEACRVMPNSDPE